MKNREGEPQHIVTGHECVHMSPQNSEQRLPSGVAAELHSDLYRNHGRQDSLNIHIILLPGVMFNTCVKKPQISTQSFYIVQEKMILNAVTSIPSTL